MDEATRKALERAAKKNVKQGNTVSAGDKLYIANPDRHEDANKIRYSNLSTKEKINMINGNSSNSNK